MRRTRATATSTEAGAWLAPTLLSSPEAPGLDEMPETPRVPSLNEMPGTAGLPSLGAVLAKSGRENFPVALRALPSNVRRRLLAIYGFARLVDDIGDELEGDRLAALDEIERQLTRVFDDAAPPALLTPGIAAPKRHEVLDELAAVRRDCPLPYQPFADLIEANRIDQHQSRYETFDDLLEYCRYSANPVGRLVLAAFGIDRVGAEERSDLICSALQVIEHLQDVAEDHRRGRTYLPQDDLARFGVTEGDLAGAITSQALRRLIAYEAARARDLLERGASIVDDATGLSRLALAGFVAGGLATLDAIEAAGFDVLSSPPRPSSVVLARHMMALCAPRRPSRPERPAPRSPSTLGGATAMGGSTSLSASLERCYDACERITRTQAKNFAYGIRLLAPPQRRAMSALYAFARRVDDVGDGTLDAVTKLDALGDLHGSVEAIRTGSADPLDPVATALSDAVRRFPIPVAALHELIEGCEMDVAATCYERFDDLLGYCTKVAGSIGRLSLGVFGLVDESARERAAVLANTLGEALQVTNILRDIAEDRLEMGRCYLPAEDLARCGASADGTGPAAAMARVVHLEAGRARALYREGLTLLPLLDRRSRACVAAMAGIYLRLLERIDADPPVVLVERVRLPTAEKLAVAAAALLGAGPTAR
jgi:phytoene synthase